MDERNFTRTKEETRITLDALRKSDRSQTATVCSFYPSFSLVFVPCFRHTNTCTHTHTHIDQNSKVQASNSIKYNPLPIHRLLLLGQMSSLIQSSEYLMKEPVSWTLVSLQLNIEKID